MGHEHKTGFPVEPLRKSMQPLYLNPARQPHASQNAYSKAGITSSANILMDSIVCSKVSEPKKKDPRT